jgi:hypothetical protein
MILIPTKDIVIFQDLIRNMLEKSLCDITSPELISVEDYIYNLKEGSLLCFMSNCRTFMAIISITNMKRKKPTIAFKVIAGENLKKHYKNLMDTLVDFAEVTNCYSMYCYGRLGVTKILQEEFGFKKVKYLKKHEHVIKVIGDSTQVFTQGEDAFSAEPRSNS